LWNAREDGGGDGRSILAFGAHPDDIELGCGGSLAKLVGQGAHVRAVIFSKGSRGALDDANRDEETRSALEILGVDDVHVLDFGDTQLWRSVDELMSVMEGHVRSLQPSRVYTMFEQDRHRDHRAVYEASAVACRSVPQILGYETPSSYPNFCPTIYEEIGSLLDTKVRSVKCHASQGARLYMQEENVRAAAHFRGVQVELGPSEAFVPYKMVLHAPR